MIYSSFITPSQTVEKLQIVVPCNSPHHTKPSSK
jgi:hypothetical protein